MDPLQEFLLSQYLGRQSQATRPGQVAQFPTANDFGINGPEQPPPMLPMPAENQIVSQDPTKPLPPEQRMEGFRRLLTDWTYSLGQGLTAASAGGRGRGLRTTAGIGQILQMPAVLQQRIDATREREQAAKLAQFKAITDATRDENQARLSAGTLAAANERNAIDRIRLDREFQDKAVDNAREATKLDLEKNEYVAVGTDIPTADGVFQLFKPKYWDGVDMNQLRKLKVGAPIIKPVNLTETEQDFADYETHPDLIAKFGPGRVGFRKWQASLIQERQAAAYQRQDPDRSFKQERELAQELLNVTNLDRQRLTSLANLESIPDNPTGADQIAVLYNFIRMMDPNRVSDSELALAQKPQAKTEELAAEAGRYFGGINVLSPEGAQRLKETGRLLGAGVQARVKESVDQYRLLAKGYELNPDNIVSNIQGLLKPAKTNAAGGVPKVLTSELEKKMREIEEAEKALANKKAVP